jgi:hypothetical protein
LKQPNRVLLNWCAAGSRPSVNVTSGSLKNPTMGNEYYFSAKDITEEGAREARRALDETEGDTK